METWLEREEWRPRDGEMNGVREKTSDGLREKDA